MADLKTKNEKLGQIYLCPTHSTKISTELSLIVTHQLTRTTEHFTGHNCPNNVVLYYIMHIPCQKGL